MNGQANQPSSGGGNNDTETRAIIIYDDSNTEINESAYQTKSVDLINISGISYQAAADIIRKKYSDGSLYTVFMFGHGSLHSQTFKLGDSKSPDKFKNDAGFMSLLKVIGEKVVSAKSAGVSGIGRKGNVCIVTCAANSTIEWGGEELKMSALVRSQLSGQTLFMTAGNLKTRGITVNNLDSFYNQNIGAYLKGSKRHSSTPFAVGGGAHSPLFYIKPNLNGTISVTR